ncbi:hypothetical protein AHMF7605_03305 [Adhaeribacter arboris]|uniref:Uncharacterized protein n=1 Tax=Adhaeribacter arboris TaxID=2072846 RepID=A0A2T2YAT3_9BACT|nr:hypothetical protein [Adhaeribacter arboris]PSR52619.1 hypothetical protein AHMF7605_03305 [Adhaeribacter arboris]
MSLANIDLSKYSIVRHRDTDKVYLFETALHSRFQEADENQDYLCYALDINGKINYTDQYHFTKEKLYWQPVSLR